LPVKGSLLAYPPNHSRQLGGFMPDTDLYRLADSTAIEPLINQWAVWSDLIAPVPYSLHMVHYQIKTLSSYVANPEIHLKALKNPKFVGGPFVDVAAERAQEVADLLDSMQREQSENIRFAAEVTTFYNYLTAEAKGQSLEPFYQKVPDLLRGYVELVYDYFNHPILRFVESLLYESRYYRKGLQSFRIFEQKHDNCRRPFLSTPRLAEEDQLDWRVPFDDPRLDELTKLEDEAKPLAQIRQLLGLEPGDEAKLAPLLTTEPPPSRERWQGQGLRVRYFGHASVLVEFNGVAILTDPWIGVNATHREVDRYSYKDLPERIDYVLITHGHHDHFVPESLLHLRHRIECLVVPRTFGLFYSDPSLKLMAQRMGFKRVVELDSLESIPLPDGEIIAFPFLGEHADLAHGKTAYLVRGGKQQILLAADSNCLDATMYEHIRKVVGAIETVFLGMECVGAPLSWLYGAFLPTKLQHSYDQSRRTRACDSEAALQLLDTVGGKRMYVYAMGSEPWLQYSMGLGPPEDSIQWREANKLIHKAQEKGFIEAKRLFGKYELHLA
jgi:L-ascorbate metabolism protein UlaG (beta-lactamase superfamily)